MILKQLKKIFKKDKRKSSSRKRKFLGYLVLALVLVYGRPGLASAKLLGQNRNNQLAHERVISNKLNSVENTLQSDSFKGLETVDNSNQLETISKLRKMR
jgi:hypothetical protein